MLLNVYSNIIYGNLNAGSIYGKYILFRFFFFFCVAPFLPFFVLVDCKQSRVEKVYVEIKWMTLLLDFHLSMHCVMMQTIKKSRTDTVHSLSAIIYMPYAVCNVYGAQWTHKIKFSTLFISFYFVSFHFGSVFIPFRCCILRINFILCSVYIRFFASKSCLCGFWLHHLQMRNFLILCGDCTRIFCCIYLSCFSTIISSLLFCVCGKSLKFVVFIYI